MTINDLLTALAERVPDADVKVTLSIERAHPKTCGECDSTTIRRPDEITLEATLYHKREFQHFKGSPDAIIDRVEDYLLPELPSPELAQTEIPAPSEAT